MHWRSFPNNATQVDLADELMVRACWSHGCGHHHLAELYEPACGMMSLGHVEVPECRSLAGPVNRHRSARSQRQRQLGSRLRHRQNVPIDQERKRSRGSRWKAIGWLSQGANLCLSRNRNAAQQRIRSSDAPESYSRVQYFDASSFLAHGRMTLHRQAEDTATFRTGSRNKHDSPELPHCRVTS